MRDQSRHPIDTQFANKLKDASAKAPARVWDGISSQMETHRLRKKVVYAQMTAAAAIALLISFTAWFYFSGQYRGEQSLNTPTQQLASASENRDLTAQACFDQEIPCEDEMVGYRPATMFAVGNSKSPSLISRLQAMMPSRAVSILGLKTTNGVRDYSDLFPIPEIRENSVIERPEIAQEKLQLNQDFLAEFAPKDDPKSTTRTRNFSLGGTVAPDLAFESQTPVALGRVSFDSKNVLPEKAEDAQRRFTPAAAVTTGINMGYEFANRFTVNSGLHYTNRKSDAQHGLYSKGEVETVKTNFEVSYLEIPATVSYEWIDRKVWSSYVSTGMSASMFLYYNNTFESASGINARNLSDKSDAFTLAQTSVLLSAGMNVKLTDRVVLNLEPRLRYGIESNSFAFAKERPVSIVGFSGINYKF